MTVLEMVQKVLDSLDGDEVNSISDTVESMKVANTLEDVFYNMVTNGDIPEHKGLLQLEALGNSAMPNYLRLPADVSRIESVRYNMSDDTRVEYKPVHYLIPEEFITRMVSLDSTEATVTSVTDPTGPTILCRNDKMPEYWTSFDDEYMVFDSYDSDIDDTLQESKSLVLGRTVPSFSKTDDFVPDIDDNLFPWLLNEAKSWASLESKQQPHQKAEQQSRRQKVFYQHERNRFDQVKDSGPDYGRRGRRG
jgi:hypothetical protein